MAYPFINPRTHVQEFSSCTVCEAFLCVYIVWAMREVYTLGAHAQRGYCSWVPGRVCLCALHLTSRVFVRACTRV